MIAPAPVQMVVMTAAELEELIERAVRAAIPQMQPPNRWSWLGPIKGSKRFGISPQAWGELIDCGRLPHVVRKSRGGRLTRFVRETDAVRVLTPQGAA